MTMGEAALGRNKNRQKSSRWPEHLGPCTHSGALEAAPGSACSSSNFAVTWRVNQQMKDPFSVSSSLHKFDLLLQ